MLLIQRINHIVNSFAFSNAPSSRNSILRSNGRHRNPALSFITWYGACFPFNREKSTSLFSSLFVSGAEWCIHGNQCKVRRGRKLKGYVTEMKRDLPYTDHLLYGKNTSNRGQAKIFYTGYSEISESLY